jgi:hypothetical protein
MKSFKLFLQVLMIAAVTASVTACSKSGSKSSSRSRYQRFGSQNNGGNMVPATAPNQAGSAQWGEITGFNRQALSYFLGGDDYSDVSSQSGQATGVRFFGTINSQSGQGYVYVYVWDTLANQGAGPLTFMLDNGQPDGFSCHGTANGNQLTIDCTNSGGAQITFVGPDSTSVFQGQVYFSGNNYLGQFRVNSGGFFQ